VCSSDLDYDEYNFFIEKIMEFGGIKTNEPVTCLTYIYAMGLKEDKVTSYRISLGKYSPRGDMTNRVFPKGKEYNGQPTAGWKKGTVNG
jgi:hypothetical protein